MPAVGTAQTGTSPLSPGRALPRPSSSGGRDSSSRRKARVGLLDIQHQCRSTLPCIIYYNLLLGAIHVTRRLSDGCRGQESFHRPALPRTHRREPCRSHSPPGGSYKVFQDRSFGKDRVVVFGCVEAPVEPLQTRLGTSWSG